VTNREEKKEFGKDKGHPKKKGGTGGAAMRETLRIQYCIIKNIER